MWRVLLIVFPFSAQAESLVANRLIKAHDLLRAEDVIIVDADIPDAATDAAPLIGLEAKVTIYPGRPLRAQDFGAPTLIERNQVVSLIYQSARLAIRTEGRSLARGRSGDVIRVINLSSRATVSGEIGTDGAVYVGPQP